MTEVISKIFLETALGNGALSFPEEGVELRGGRITPIVFNSGCFNNGQDLAALTDAYIYRLVRLGAKSNTDKGVEFNTLFGMAYKGIPIASCTTLALWCSSQKWVECAHDRKEEKLHNEGGIFVGADLKDKKIVLLDDAITEGGSCIAGAEMIKQAGGILVGVVVGLDRQEKGVTGNPKNSALQEFACNHNVPVAAIFTMQDIVDYLTGDQSNAEVLQRILEYRTKYGVKI